MSQLLTDKLSAVRRKRATLTACTGVAIAIGAFVLLFGLTMVIDWWVELPWTVRAIMLAIELAALVYLVTFEIVRPILFGPDDEELALSVEQATPSFASRLISSIQFLRLEAAEGMSRSMVAQLLRETEQMAQPMDFTRVVKPDRLAKYGTIASVIVVMFIAAVAFTAPASLALVQRAMLMNVPVPRKTIVECLSKDMYVPRGESVTISAKASGLVIPRDGAVKLKFDAGGTQTFSMDRVEGSKDTYQRTIDNVQDDFTYTVYLNDGRSQAFKVTAAIRPAVASVDCRQKYPAYTGLSVVKRNTGDLSLLEGSRLLLTVTANKAVKITNGDEKEHNYVHLHGCEQDFPLTVNRGNPTLLTVSDAGEDGIPLPKGTTGFSVHLVDDQGLTSENPAVYPISLTPDEPPRISITSPQRNDELVTTAATVQIGFEASDDYAVSQVLLQYRTVDPDGNSSATVTGDGLKAEYFHGTDFIQKVVERIDPIVSFQWDAKALRTETIPKRDASIRWTGQLQPSVTGNYTFTVDTPASVRLWLDDQPIIDTLTGSGPKESKPISLKAFHRYDLKLQYVTHGQIVPIDLQWQGPGMAKQSIPREVLFSTPLADKTALVASGGLNEKVIKLQTPTNKSVRAYYEWKISDLAASLPLGSTIQWRLEAIDNNNVTGPGITFSEPLRQLRLVSDADKRKELLDRMGDNLATLSDIADEQRRLQDKDVQMVTGTPQDAPLDLPPNPNAPKK